MPIYQIAKNKSILLLSKSLSFQQLEELFNKQIYTSILVGDLLHITHKGRQPNRYKSEEESVKKKVQDIYSRRLKDKYQLNRTNTFSIIPCYGKITEDKRIKEWIVAKIKDPNTENYIFGHIKKKTPARYIVEHWLMDRNNTEVIVLSRYNGCQHLENMKDKKNGCLLKIGKKEVLESRTSQRFIQQ
ncbi:36035_t:CDS:2 [Gigaspora margarita]|uniref:36035_t:CDS:1 n=1 Tax=Gigaspora margarita TaxID=4874 RepID=A0ABM8W107_GIGMA|nr:36035_t:CDS:2 [Gigaspora margarita]